MQELSRLVQIDELTVARRVQAACADRPACRCVRDRFGLGAGVRRSEGRKRRRRMGSAPRLATTTTVRRRTTRPCRRNMGCRLLRPSAHRRRPSQLRQEDYLLACLLHDPDLVIALSAEAVKCNVMRLCRIGNTWRIKRSFRALKRYIAGDADWDVGRRFKRADELLARAAGHVARRRGHTAAYFDGGVSARVAQGIVADAPGSEYNQILRIKYLIDDAQRRRYGGSAPVRCRQQPEPAHDVTSTRHLGRADPRCLPYRGEPKRASRFVSPQGASKEGDRWQGDARHQQTVRNKSRLCRCGAPNLKTRRTNIFIWARKRAGEDPFDDIPDGGRGRR